MSFLLGTLLATVGRRTCHVASRRISRAMSISCAMACQHISARASRCRHTVQPTRPARSRARARASIVAAVMHAAAAVVAAAHPVTTAATNARATGGHPAGSVVYVTTTTTIHAPAAARVYRCHCCCCVSPLLRRLVSLLRRVRALRRAARLRRLQSPFHPSDAALSAAHHTSGEQLSRSAVFLVTSPDRAAAFPLSVPARAAALSLLHFVVGE